MQIHFVSLAIFSILLLIAIAYLVLVWIDTKKYLIHASELKIIFYIVLLSIFTISGLVVYQLYTAQELPNPNNQTIRLNF